MLDKKFWIPILLVLIGVAIGGTFWGKHVASQAPVKVIHAVTPDPVERSQPAAPKNPPPGETAESGHWHGDEWHAEPHEPVIEEVADVPVEDYRDVELEAYEASLSHFTDEERATYDRALTGEITRHREKYPDCQDHDAVFEDADRFSRWYLAYLEHNKRVDAAYAEWSVLSQERPFTFDYNELVQMRDSWTDAEKAAWTAKGDDWLKRREAAFKRYNEIKAQRPVSPKPRHTH